MRRSLIVLMAALIGAEAAAQQPVRFDRTRRMTPPVSSPAAAAADMNGDGLDDLALSGGTTRLWLGTPDGRLIDSGTTFPGVFRDTPLLFDVGGDGDMDLALATRATCNFFDSSCFGGQNRLFENDGTGNLSEATFRFPAADFDVTLAAAAGDVTGDGLPDLVLGQEEHCWDDGFGSAGCVGGGAEIWVQDGSGNFAQGGFISLTSSDVDVGIVRLGDLDGDGDLDLYLGGGNSFSSPGDLHLAQLNNGLGIFTEAPGLLPPPPLSGFDGVLDTVLADVEDDGDMDLVTSFRINTQGQARLYVNDGLGGFAWAPARLSGSGAYGILVTDFQSDGLPDLVLGYAHETRLATNDGAGTFTTGGPLPGALGRFAASFTALDIGGDGDVDLALAASEVHLFLGDDTGAFVNAPGTLPWTIGSGPTVLFDADGDADLDVAMARGFGGYLFENDGSGQLSSTSFGEWTGIYNGTGSGVDNLVAADFDGDGDQDLVGSRGHVFENEVSGLRLDEILTRGPGGPDEDGFVVASDFDGDGATDLAFASFPSIGLQRNLGGLDFDFVTPEVIPGVLAGVLAAGDVDGDGAADLVGSGFSATTQLLLNRPSGFVDASAAMPAGTLPLFSSVSSYALGDVDLDGDLDLLIGTTSQSAQPTDLLYLNLGTSFDDVSATNLPGLMDRTFAVELADLDVDGDPDAFVVASGVTRFLTNDGSGVFTADAAALPSTVLGGAGLALGDLDGDADEDAVISFSGASVDVLVNLSRQLAWDTFPRIGQTLGLGLWGTPGASWKLAFSPGRGRFLPAFGNFFLEPSTLQVAGRGTLDTDGYARYTTRIPADPALVGLVLYGQALIGDPLRLSNLEVIRVTGF